MAPRILRVVVAVTVMRRVANKFGKRSVCRAAGIGIGAFRQAVDVFSWLGLGDRGSASNWRAVVLFSRRVVSVSGRTYSGVLCLSGAVLSLMAANGALSEAYCPLGACRWGSRASLWCKLLLLRSDIATWRLGARVDPP